MSIGMIRCFECKEKYANRKGIMYTQKYSNGRNHKVCYSCLWDIMLRTLKGSTQK